MQPVMSAIQPVIAGSEIKALRTHEASMQFSSEIKSKLEGMNETYGLVIEDISIVWYQTTNEKAAAELERMAGTAIARDAIRRAEAFMG